MSGRNQTIHIKRDTGAMMIEDFVTVEEFLADYEGNGWFPVEKHEEIVEECRKPQTQDSGKGYGVGISDYYKEKLDISEEELGWESEEKSDESTKIEEALESDENPATNVEELWQQAYQNEREEKGYGNNYQSKDEKVQEITEQLGSAWQLPEEDSNIDIDESVLAEELAKRLENSENVVEQLNTSKESESEETTEELESRKEIKREAVDKMKERGGAWADIGEEIEEELGDDLEESEGTQVVELENALDWQAVEELSDSRKSVTIDGEEATAMVDDRVAKAGTKLGMVDEVFYQDEEKGRIIFRNKFG